MNCASVFDADDDVAALLPDEFFDSSKAFALLPLTLPSPLVSAASKLPATSLITLDLLLSVELNSFDIEVS